MQLSKYPRHTKICDLCQIFWTMIFCHSHANLGTSDQFDVCWTSASMWRRDVQPILISDVTFVFISSFVREYPGRGYVQESMIYIQLWYIGTVPSLLWNCILLSRFIRSCDGNSGFSHDVIFEQSRSGMILFGSLFFQFASGLVRDNASPSWGGR